jgi:hypothetical protein
MKIFKSFLDLNKIQILKLENKIEKYLEEKRNTLTWTETHRPGPTRANNQPNRKKSGFAHKSISSRGYLQKSNLTTANPNSSPSRHPPR